MSDHRGAGFTLIELLVVIAIIAILGSIAISQYIKYQRKAKIISYAQPLGRGCLIDIVAYCITNQGEPINLSTLINCRNTTIPTPGGDVTLDISITGSCSSEGNPPPGYVNAYLDGVTDFYSNCYFEGTSANRSIRCTIKSK